MARGTVRIERERCKACELCIQACPQHVLQLSPTLNAHGYRPVELIETPAEQAGLAGQSTGIRSCTGCGICALVCPDLVFTVYREPVHARRAA